jgi:hypothetical protein
MQAPQLMMPPIMLVGHQHEDHDAMMGPFDIHIQSAWFRISHADTNYSENDSESESDEDSE